MKNKKILLFIILSLIVIVLVFFSSGKRKNEKPNDVQNNNQNDIKKPEIKEPDEIGTNYLNNVTYTNKIDKDAEKVIVEFFNVYYNSIKELRENDMTYLFDKSNNEDALINQTALSLLIETRKLKPNDLKLDKAKYDLDFVKVENNGNIIKVKVLENNYLNFNFMKDIESKIYNIGNYFTLKKINGEYKIIEFDKVQDFYVMITDNYRTGGKTKLESIKNNHLKVIKEMEEKNKKDYNDFLNNKNRPYKKADHEYDRVKAKEATKWVNKRNPDWYNVKDANCQSFASYVLKSGGIPNDYEGVMQTIWADDKINQGYYSWTSVPRFMTYAKKNTGYGLVSTPDANLYYAESGDIIHVGTVEPSRHALVVKEPLIIDDKVVDILVNSNTIDLENFPMSAYSYPYVSLIKIHGWNE